MIRLGETDRLDQLALRTAAVGAICATVAFVLPSWSVNWIRWIGPAAMLVGAAPAIRRERFRGALFGAAAVLAYAAFSGFTTFADVLAGAVIGFGLTRHLTLGQPKDITPPMTKRAAAITLAALAWPISIEALSSAAEFSLGQSVVPPVVVQAAAGGVAGLVLGLTTVPLFIQSAADPVEEALKRMQPTLDAELRMLVLRIIEVRTRALKLIEQSRASVHSRMETRRGLDAVAVTAIDLTNRFSSVDRVLSRLPAPEIDGRIANVRTQLETMTDPGVKRDLERTLVTLTEQRQQVDRLLQGRARLVARLQSEQAALEKTEMAFALLASGDAAIAGVQLETISSSLGRQAHEFEVEGSALQEMLTVSPRHVLEQIQR